MNINGSHQFRLTDIFLEAIQSVDGGRCVEQYLRKNPMSGDICLVSIGKAACSMASGARIVLGEQIKQSLVVTKHGHRPPELPGKHVLEAGHPLPDQQSLEAGHQLLSLLHAVPENTQILFLISNNTSTLIKVLPKFMTIKDLTKLNN